LPDIVLSALFKNYADHILFNLFLYPYFIQETLLKIMDSGLFSKICSYLHECCQRVEDAVYFTHHVYNSTNGFITDQVFVWPDDPKADYDASTLRDFLIKNFKLDGLEKAEISKNPATNNTLIFSFPGNSVSITLNDNRTKAILKIKGKKQYEFIVRKGHRLSILEVPTTRSVQESATFRLLISNQLLLMDLIFSIV
jgi:hypothetical protein